jgi:hypothetical protein
MLLRPILCYEINFIHFSKKIFTFQNIDFFTIEEHWFLRKGHVVVTRAPITPQVLGSTPRESEILRI